MTSEIEDIAVTKFREYLRINTEQPNPDTDACSKFLRALAGELDIPVKIYEPVAGYPILVMTITGTDPSLQAIALYSHTDVVPTFREHWKYDPYAAVKEDNGDIYARGSQDMKCVGSQYVEAIRCHFLRGKKQWKRTIHIIWGPDEEVGGLNGMGAFVTTDDYKNLNIGFTMDEGSPSLIPDLYPVYYADRCLWWFTVTFRGSPGHASQFIENTAMEKMHIFMNEALAFRDQQRQKLESDPMIQQGDIVTLNITIAKGGVQFNVVPDKFELTVDMRVPPTENFNDMEKLLASWCKKAGDDVTYNFFKKGEPTVVTPHTSADQFFAALEKAWKELGCKIHTTIFPAGTDSSHIRKYGHKSIGFSPLLNVPILAHAHNEYLNEKDYLRGVEIYEKLIEAIASVEEHP